MGINLGNGGRMNPAGMMADSTKGRAGGNLWNHKKPAVKNFAFF